MQCEHERVSTTAYKETAHLLAGEVNTQRKPDLLGVAEIMELSAPIGKRCFVEPIIDCLNRRDFPITPIKPNRREYFGKFRAAEIFPLK